MSETPLDPEIFGPGPARDARFEVRDRWREMENHPRGTPEYRREFFHRQMNEEMNVMEQAAQALVDFPDAPWEIRKAIAGQCADEARHTRAYLRIMKQRGIRVGEYPVLNFQFRMLERIDSLIGRLAIENRTFEADGLDAAVFGAAESWADGDVDFAHLLDAQAADEVTHVGLGISWIRKEMSRDPRVLLDMARAIGQLRTAFKEVFGEAGAGTYGVAVEERLQAGFGAEEVARAVELQAERRASAG